MTVSKILIFSEIICYCLPLHSMVQCGPSDLHTISITNHISKATKGSAAHISSLSELHSEVEN